MNVVDLSVDELKALIKEAVEEKLEEILGDPDQGRQLKETVRARLVRSVSAKTRGIPIEKVAADMGLSW